VRRRGPPRCIGRVFHARRIEIETGDFTWSPSPPPKDGAAMRRSPRRLRGPRDVAVATLDALIFRPRGFRHRRRASGAPIRPLGIVLGISVRVRARSTRVAQPAVRLKPELAAEGHAGRHDQEAGRMLEIEHGFVGQIRHAIEAGGGRRPRRLTTVARTKRRPGRGCR